jgi:hypothetical protein
MDGIKRWNAREIADHMAKATGTKMRSSGSSWICKCPADGGLDRLSCTDTTDRNGKPVVLFKCFADCDFISIVKGLRDYGIDIPPSNPRKKEWKTAAALPAPPVKIVEPKPEEYLYAPERAGERPYTKAEISEIKDTVTAIYNWYDDDKRIVFHTVRIVNRYGRKKVLPVTPWTEIATGRLVWRLKGPLGLQPLYNTPRDVGQPTVLVLEGEKTANAAIRLFAGQPVWVTATHGGTSAPARTAWTRLKGRRVIIGHDLDPSGMTYAASTAAAAREEGARDVRLWTVPTSHVIAEGLVTERTTPYKKGYDLFDAIEDGWTLQRLARIQSPWFGPEVVSLR